MKNSTLILLLAVSGVFATPGHAQNNAPNTNATSANTTYAVVGREANSRRWAKVISQTNAAGNVTLHTNSAYEELATGICFKDQNGNWQDSLEQIDIVADGAQATHGRHTVHWMSNVNTPGTATVHLVAPDGKVFDSKVFGLSYSDLGTGSNVLISGLQDSHGQLVGSNKVVYPSAFQNLDASIEYFYKKSGLEQNIVLRQQPPTPESFGLNPATTMLTVVTEFISPPNPAKATEANNGVSDDTFLDFGQMKIGAGQAFSTQEATNDVPPPGATHVYKSWIREPDGRTFLIEGVPYRSISNAVQNLPPHASVNPAGIRAFKDVASMLQESPKAVASTATPGPMRLAKAEGNGPGFVIDYTTMTSSATNYVFEANVTYYVTGNVLLDGSNVFEGGTVVKFYNSYQEYLILDDSSATFVFGGSEYRPSVFTDFNDNSVGDTISGSSGTPSTGSAVCLYSSATNLSRTIAHARFSYALVAYGDGQPGALTVRDCQFVNCAWPIFFNYSTTNQVYFQNVLESQISDGVLYGYDLSVFGEQMTLDSCAGNGFVTAVSAYSGNITNSIFTDVAGGTNSLSFYNSAVLGSASGVYQTVGAGNYYLANGSPYANAGTTNIDPSLLQELATLTTYPPVVYSNATISVATNLGIQATRDSETPGPDLGYHYDPLDYVFGGTTVNGNITFAAGTGIGWFRTTSGWEHAGYGISLANYTTASFEGSATAPVWWVRANTVQERGGSAPWQGGYGPGGLDNQDASQYGDNISEAPQALLNFTRTSVLANGENGVGQNFRDDYGYLILQATNSEFYGGQTCYGYVNSCFFTNCLFDNTACAKNEGHAGTEYIFRNCTFHGGAIYILPDSAIPVSFRDNAFDGTTTGAWNYGTDYATNYDYEAFTNTAAEFPVGGAHDVIVTNGYNWQTSWFGNYYLPSNSTLITAGDETSDLIGLYHFTTQTNQTIEGTNIVDIGYHYVATDSDGNPLDTPADGIPDYLADSNGDGVYDSGDLADWLLFTYPIVSSSNGLWVFTPLK